VAGNSSLSARRNMLAREIQSSDYTLLSFPRCGRTWTRWFLGHYCVRAISNTLSHNFTADKTQPNRPTIAIRHDYMSFYDEIATQEYNSLVKQNKFVFEDLMHEKKMIYLLRNPIDIMVSYYHYVNHHRKTTNFKNFLECCEDEIHGMNHLIRFLNLQLDHCDSHSNQKIIVKYEKLKQGNQEWIKLLEFLQLPINETWVQECHHETSFEKMNKIDQNNGNSKFYRQGGSDYVNELSDHEKKIVSNWPGLSNLLQRIA